jgi:hypothetical protein
VIYDNIHGGRSVPESAHNLEAGVQDRQDRVSVDLRLYSGGGEEVRFAEECEKACEVHERQWVNKSRGVWII